jgi:hypothetical protein
LSWKFSLLGFSNSGLELTIAFLLHFHQQATLQAMLDGECGCNAVAIRAAEACLRQPAAALPQPAREVRLRTVDGPEEREPRPFRFSYDYDYTKLLAVFGAAIPSARM